jgi:hypothetical protein
MLAGKSNGRFPSTVGSASRAESTNRHNVEKSILSEPFELAALKMDQQTLDALSECVHLMKEAYGNLVNSEEELTRLELGKSI